MTAQGDTGFFRKLADRARGGEERPRGFFSGLRRRLLVGFLVAFPLVVTLFFARFLFELLDRWFRPISKHFFGFPIPGAGMLLSMIGLFFLGILATNVLGSRFLDLFERWINRLPLLSPIYQGARQITEAIHVRDTSQFQEVVLIPFPHPGCRSIGFVTRDLARGTRFSDEPASMVFVPTTPNPTSGFLIAVPRSDVERLDITIEEGVKLVISGGLLVPDRLLETPHEASGTAEIQRAGNESRPDESDDAAGM